MPVLQDAPGAEGAVDGVLWGALGAAYDSVLVVGPGGLVAGRIAGPVFPDKVAELEALVNSLLGL